MFLCHSIEISISLERLYQFSPLFPQCKGKSITYIEMNIIFSRFLLFLKYPVDNINRLLHGKYPDRKIVESASVGIEPTIFCVQGRCPIPNHRSVTYVLMDKVGQSWGIAGNGTLQYTRHGQFNRRTIIFFIFY